jgi:hypothetical protein
VRLLAIDRRNDDDIRDAEAWLFCRVNVPTRFCWRPIVPVLATEVRAERLLKPVVPSSRTEGLAAGP